jgi:hypothetical protein
LIPLGLLVMSSFHSLEEFASDIVIGLIEKVKLVTIVIREVTIAEATVINYFALVTVNSQEASIAGFIIN